MLKVDYRDDMFSGSRKYAMVDNGDKTISLLDMTEYTQEGDQFGANDINAINEEINRLGNCIVVALPASKWTVSAPYGLVVEVPGIKETDRVGIHLYAPKTLPMEEIKLRQKQTSMITSGASSDGYMTFWCGVKRPSKDFQVLLTGVSGQEGGE